MAAGSIIEEWLRSLNLVNYTLAFLDNGYDDLEICKQIGEADLDAIGVFKAPHRKEILKAVRNLRELGGTAVYFTLENPDENVAMELSDTDECHTTEQTENVFCQTMAGRGNYQNADDVATTAPEPPAVPFRRDEYELGKIALLSFPKLQLRMILRDKLVEDNINLAEPPYTNTGGKSGPGMEKLCHRYATELKTFVSDVREALEEHRKVRVCIDKSPDKEDSPQGSPTRNIYNLFSIYGQSLRSVPPPLPSCPPPSHSYADPLELDLHATKSASLPGSPRSIGRSHLTIFSADALAGQNTYCVTCTSVKRTPTMLADSSDINDVDASQKKSSGLGKFFKNVGIRRSGRKYTYKVHEGDLLASEITMSDEDRIQLMLQVKEGKLSMEEAVEKVKQYESERRSSSSHSTPERSISSQHSTPDAGRKSKQIIPRRRKKSEESGKSGSSKDLSTTRSSADYSETSIQISPEDEAGISFANNYFIDGKSSPMSVVSCSPGVLRSSTETSNLRLASSPCQGSPLHVSSRKNSLSSGSSIHSPMEKRRSSGGSSPSVQSPRHGRTGSLSSCSSTRSSPQHQIMVAQQQQPRTVLQPQTSQTFIRPPHVPGFFSSPEHKIVMGTAMHGSPVHRSGVSMMTQIHSQHCVHGNGRMDNTGHGNYVTDLDGCQGKSQSQTPAGPWMRGHQHGNAKSAMDSPFDKRRSLNMAMSDPVVKQQEDETSKHSQYHERQISSDTSSDRLKEIDSGDDKNFVKSQSISCDRHQESRSEVRSNQSQILNKLQNIALKGTSDAQTDIMAISSPEECHVHDFQLGSDSEPSGGLELYISPHCIRHSTPPLSGLAAEGFHFGGPSAVNDGVMNSRIQRFNWQRSGSYSTEDGLSSDEQEGQTQKSGKQSEAVMQQRNVSTFRPCDPDKQNQGQDKAPPHQKKEESSGSPSHDPRLDSSMESMHSVSSVATSSSGARSSVDDELSYTGPFVGVARVHSDFMPANPSHDMLTFKKGDIIHVIKRSDSGLWKGLCNNKIGMFPLSHVELLPEESCRQIKHRQRQAKRRNSRRSKPRTVEELLQRLALQHLLTIFLMNGYGKLETFRDLDPDDLTDLGITDAEERAKILTAVELLQDYDSMGCDSPEPNAHSTPTDGSTGASSQSPNTVSSCDSPQPINTGTTGSRDSGCYASHENLINKIQKSDNKEMKDSQLTNGIKTAIGKESSHLQESSTITQGKVLKKPSDIHRKPQPKESQQQAQKITNLENGDLSQEDREIISITNGQQKSVDKKTSVTMSGHKHHSKLSQPNGQVITGSGGSRLPLAQPSRIPLNSGLSNEASSKNKQQQQKRIVSVKQLSATDKQHSCDSSLGQNIEGSSPKKQYVPKPLPQALGKISLSPKHGPSSGGGGIRRPPPVPKRNSNTRAVQLTRQTSVDGQKPQHVSSSPPPPGVSVGNNPNIEQLKRSHSRTRSLPENILPESSAVSRDKHGGPSTDSRHHQRRVSKTLETMVLAQLEKDGIDLSRPTHIDKSSVASLVPWLVQRYSGLLQRDSQEIALALDQARSKQLRKHKLTTAEAKLDIKPAEPASTQQHGSVSEFLHTSGLPVYTDCFLRHGYHSLESLKEMSEQDLKRCGVHDPKHIKKLLRAIDSLRAQSVDGATGSSRSSKLAGVKDKV